MKLIHLEQSGPQWLNWRKEGVGGSDAPIILEEVSWTTPEQLREIKFGLRTVVENERMARGKRLEPMARHRYQEMTGIKVRPICCQHDTYSWMRASLDGLSEDGRIVLEIKCPSDFAHRKALRGYYPSYYKAQLQHQLAVTGLSTLHYFSYSDAPGFSEHDQCALVEVGRDEVFIADLIERERKFFQSLKRSDLS